MNNKRWTYKEFTKDKTGWWAIRFSNKDYWAVYFTNESYLVLDYPDTTIDEFIMTKIHDFEVNREISNTNVKWYE